MLSASDMEAEGQRAFDAYRKAVNGITYDGKPIPSWVLIGEKQKIGWRAAARAVIDHYEKENAR